MTWRVRKYGNPTGHAGVRLGWDVYALRVEHEVSDTKPMGATGTMPPWLRDRYLRMVADLEAGVREGSES